MARYSLRPLESGRVQARWYLDDGSRTSKTFNTRTEAKRFLDRVSADRQRGDYIDPRDAERRFEEVAEDWLATKVKRPGTLAGYESLLRNHLLPTFGTRPVGRLTTTDIRKWLAEMQRKGCAPGTVRNAYRVLKPVLDSAVEQGCLRSNPCGPLRRDDLPRSRRTNMLFLDAAEVAMLAEAAGEYGVVIDFAARTGMRAGEIGALRMERIDLLRGTVRVVESLSEVRGVQHFLAPKSGEERTVVLPPTLVRQLRDYLATAPAKGPRDFLFTDPTDASAPMRHNAWFYQRVFKPAVRRAGLNPALRFHDLRHTCASLLIEQNTPLKAIQEHLGHASATLTLDRYGHLYPAATEQVRSALERAFA